MGVESYVQGVEGMVGPMTAAQLRQMAARGEVTPQSRVRRGDMPKWIRVGNVKGLFTAALVEDGEEESDSEQGMSRPLLITLFGVPCLALVVAAVVIVNHNRSLEQARVERANAQLKDAIVRADNWVESGKAANADALEQDLVAALADERVQGRAAGETVLGRVKARKVLDEGKHAVDQGEVERAAKLLRVYLADSRATQKAEATTLLDDIEASLSSEAPVAGLAALPEPEYLEFRRTQKLPGGKALHPVIEKRRATTLAAAVPLAERKREAARQKAEADQLAALERQKAEAGAKAEEARSAPLTVFLGGTVRGEDAAYWRSPRRFYESAKGKPKSEFDDPDKWESKFSLDYIPLADGVFMMLSVKNIDNFFGADWSWLIFAACPAKGRHQSCSVAFSIDGKIETCSLTCFSTARSRPTRIGRLGRSAPSAQPSAGSLRLRPSGTS